MNISSPYHFKVDRGNLNMGGSEEVDVDVDTGCRGVLVMASVWGRASRIRATAAVDNYAFETGKWSSDDANGLASDVVVDKSDRCVTDPKHKAEFIDFAVRNFGYWPRTAFGGISGTVGHEV